MSELDKPLVIIDDSSYGNVMTGSIGHTNIKYERPRRNLHCWRNPVSTVAAPTEYPRRGRGAAATRLRERPPRNNT